jgi:putative hydrolase of the HAD superfamily
MFKQYSAKLFAIGALAILCTTFCMEQLHTPENTKFAFDFHDVVVKAKPNRVINGLFNRTMIPEINWNLPYNTARYLYNLPWVAYESALLIYTNEASGERYYDLFIRYHYDQLASAIKTIANDLEIIDATVAIIKELKDKGYEVDIASDIGTSFLKDLESQPKFKAILDLFNKKKSVDYIHTSPPIHKPNKQFFIDYQNAYNTTGKKIIFIDDRKRNVSTSEEVGMIGIHFQNPEQLRNELVTRGILEEQEK